MAAQRSVLVVDDDPDIRIILAENVEAAGWRVATAANAEQALVMLQSEPFDALLTDIRMGTGSTGVWLANEAHRRWPDMGVVLMTGFSSAFTDVKDLPFQVLRKPVRTATILGALDAVA